ncbi:MAG: hypothetical protein Q8L05_09440, partial [Actinomycetota bacterium]|nr:hypothetical protein [Actinomycetota bacterium]
TLVSTSVGPGEAVVNRASRTTPAMARMTSVGRRTRGASADDDQNVSPVRQIAKRARGAASPASCSITLQESVDSRRARYWVDHARREGYAREQVLVAGNRYQL